MYLYYNKRVPLISSLSKVVSNHVLDQLTLRAFFQKCLHFGDFQVGYGLNQLQSTPKSICKMPACLSFHQHRLLQHSCSGMLRNQNFWMRKLPTCMSLYLFFHLSFFSSSDLFASVIDLLRSLLPFQNIPRKHN